MRGFRRFAGTVGLLAIIVACLLAVHNYRGIDDWLKLRNYQPLAAVAKIADEDSMTAEARHIFYVNHPDLITDAATFHSDCPTYEQTIVLGCYHSNQRGIFVYEIQDSRLNGVVEVTSAHEMLHGAYERLSKKEKNQVNTWLNDYYQNGLKDKRIIDTINAYKKNEPNDVVDEMHSVFGTEVSNLSPQLENYYKQYFSNRAAVTAFADGYEAEFTSRLNQISNMEQQLTTLKERITTEESNLSSQLAAIESDRRRLDSLRSSGRSDAYNAEVANFNREVDAYNAAVAQIRSDISSYNDLVQARNQLASELRSLYNSLDNNFSTQPTQ